MRRYAKQASDYLLDNHFGLLVDFTVALAAIINFGLAYIFTH